MLGDCISLELPTWCCGNFLPSLKISYERLLNFKLSFLNSIVNVIVCSGHSLNVHQLIWFVSCFFNLKVLSISFVKLSSSFYPCTNVQQIFCKKTVAAVCMILGPNKRT